MAHGLPDKLKNYSPDPTKGSVQSFDTMSKETPDEKEDNQLKQHKTSNPPRKALGGMNDLDC